MLVAQIVPAIRIGGLLHCVRLMQSLPGLQSICVSVFDADEDEALRSLAIPVVRLRIPLRQATNRERIVSELAQVFRRCGAELIHTHHIACDRFAVDAATAAAIPIIRTIHGITQRNRENAEAVARPRAAWSSAEIAEQLELQRRGLFTLVVSDHLKQWVVGLGFHEHDVEVLYPGVDVLAAHCDTADPAAAREVLRIAFPHRIEPVKGPYRMLEIAKALNQRGVRFEVLLPEVGTELDMIRSRALDLGLIENFVWLGVTTDLWSRIQCADIFLLTSVSEGLPVTILEAMVRSIPVVCSDVGGIREIVDHRVSGYLCNHCETAQFVAAIDGLRLQSHSAHRIGTAGRQVVLARFSASMYQNTLYNVYRNRGRKPTNEPLLA